MEDNLKHIPQRARAHFNKGIAFYRQKAWPQAIICFKNALDCAPHDAQAAFNLATALRENGAFNQAILIYEMTLKIAPNMAEAHYRQGMCFMLAGRPELSSTAIGKAVYLEPHNAQYWFHLAQAQLALEDIDTALGSYRKAVELRPEWEAAHYNLAVVLRMTERIEEAIAHTRKAVALCPDYAKAFALLFRLAQHACDWQLAASAASRLDEITRMELERGNKTTEPPLTNIRRHPDARANMQIARSWSRHLVESVAGAPVLSPGTYPATPLDRLRVGYLSSDFKDHAVAHQIRGLLEQHDRNHFDIFGYACNPDDGTPYRQLLADACDQFRDVHAKTNLSIAQQIHQDDIHILVDMSGHSRDNRLGICALRPAPIQVSYLGFLSTTGADFIDYVIADPIVVPYDHARYYTEKIAYLPYCYQANDDRLPIADIDYCRSQWHLPEGGFVYCSFNQPYKINADVFDAWLRILKRVPHGVLWLIERSALARKNLCRAAECAGVDPVRLIFSGFLPLDRNLARLQLADLVLDTLTYNGGATTANALWAGVPVLTVPGGHWVSRMSASALNAIGLPELVVGDLNSYEDLAVELARNQDKLKNLRLRLRQQRTTTPLFDTPTFARHLETAFRHMWDRHAGGLPAATFHVEP